MSDEVSQSTGDQEVEPQQEPSRGRRGPWRTFVFPVIALLAVALAIWLLQGRPGLGGGEDLPEQTILVSTQGGQYVAVDVGPVGGSGGPRIGEPAPDFVLPDLDGNPIQLSQLRGKVVLINFWATWCVPCRKEIPGLVRVYEKYKDQGFEIVAVDLEEPQDRVTAFVQDWGMSYINVIDRDSGVVRQYRLTGIPESFFVDQNGVLRDLRIGEMKESFVACVVEALLADANSYEAGRC